MFLYQETADCDCRRFQYFQYYCFHSLCTVLSVLFPAPCTNIFSYVKNS
ncbi:MAG: SWIM zinc finger family protein [Lachnospiraceae bacterium]